MPSASDGNWCHKVCDMHAGKSKHFEKPRLSQTSYVIVHFADRVEYQIEGFVEKNRDTVLDEQVKLLKASTVSWSLLSAQSCLFDLEYLPTPTGSGFHWRLSLFFHTVSQELMHIGSPFLICKGSMMSLGNPFILVR